MVLELSCIMLLNGPLVKLYMLLNDPIADMHMLLTSPLAISFIIFC